MVELFFDVARKANHQNEVIPTDLVQACLTTTEGVGLLTLHGAVADWGMEAPVGVKDPTGKDWKGVGARHGKHYTDYSYGGISICHADSSMLRQLYTRFGPPPIPAAVLASSSFDQLLQSRYRAVFLAWAQPVSVNERIWKWCVDFWMAKFWTPAVMGNPDLRTAVLNARIRNSASGLGDDLAGKPFETQAKAYVDYKRDHRGEDAAKRTERQVLEVRKVVAILDAKPSNPPKKKKKIEPVD